MSISLLGAIFFIEIIAIYHLSRWALTKSYPLLKYIFKNNTAVIFFVALIYFPGTVIHEISHYLVALLLGMHPSEIRLFPHIEGKNIKLGHVLYEKGRNDYIRSVLVGIAPFFGGLFSLWLIVQTHLFPSTLLWQTILFGYMILTISANMFSSKQDLIDVGYLIPLSLFIGLLWYLFPIQIAPSLISQLIPPITYFFQTLQGPFLFSIGIHLFLVILLSLKMV